MSTEFVQNLQPFGARLQAGLCPTCGTKPGFFRDVLSAREYQISGMCQACQDSVFECDDYCDCNED